MTRKEEVSELRGVLRMVLRGLWRHRRPNLQLDVHLSPRQVAVLAHVAAAGPMTVGEVANEVGLSLPAASKLIRDLADHDLLERREDEDDRRRTVVDLGSTTAAAVRAWLVERNRPLEKALDALTVAERAAFLKGLHALADALMEESAHGSVGSHHRAPHRRRPHRHRPL
jgi:DNA-binding MarR family transcriptional regulator